MSFRINDKRFNKDDLHDKDTLKLLYHELRRVKTDKTIKEIRNAIAKRHKNLTE